MLINPAGADLHRNPALGDPSRRQSESATEVAGALLFCCPRWSSSSASASSASGNSTATHRGSPRSSSSLGHRRYGNLSEAGSRSRRASALSPAYLRGAAAQTRALWLASTRRYQGCVAPSRGMRRAVTEPPGAPSVTTGYSPLANLRRLKVSVGARGQDDLRQSGRQAHLEIRGAAGKRNAVFSTGACGSGIAEPGHSRDRQSLREDDVGLPPADRRRGFQSRRAVGG